MLLVTPFGKWIATAAITIISVTNLDGSKDILGKWKYEEASVPTVAKAIINQVVARNPSANKEELEANIDDIKEMVRSIEIDFKDDGTVEVQTPQGPQTLKYKLVGNAAPYTVEITRPDGTNKKDVILSLTPTKIKYVNVERGDTAIYIRP
jgi:hypothetical protein